MMVINSLVNIKPWQGRPEAPAACIKEALQDQATTSQNGTFGGFRPG
jgi:hypothetical protein